MPMNVNTKSGPHPHLLSQSGEVREVQFEVQRFCPNVPPVDDREREFFAYVQTLMPFAVWVQWPKVQPPGYIDGCGDECYRLTDEGKRVFEEQFGVFSSRYASRWVCEHMGRLIE